MNELNKELRAQAVHLGLCDQWQKLWVKDWSEQKMVEQMYRGLDFCLQHHWPSNDFLQKHFEKEFLRESRIFVDDKYSANNPKESLVLGKSDMIFRYNSDCHGIIHIRDNSTAKLTARGRSFVIVHLYEKAYINAEQFDSARIVVVKHSPAVTIVADECIKVREEYDYLK